MAAGDRAQSPAPNQTVHTQSQSDARGSAGAFSSTSGAKGAEVSGAGGNNAAVVKGPGGDVYAGADGNVYKKTSDGWSKYDNGSWNAAQKPSGSQSNAAAAQRTTAPRTAASAGAENTRQLDQDRQARTQGAQRQQQFNASRTNAQGSRSAAGRSGSALR